ncbi:MAG: glycosyltransferase family 2 protein [Anaerolineales bacterium]|nr:glycosyltransferase family 2 protein [Anaerolineales bacterium]
MNPASPKLSVIIAAYNAAETLPNCLAALHHQTKPEWLHEIIVVDNGSTDPTAAVARAAGATVVYQPKRGPAAARNAGIQVATGNIICITDADCQPTANWLEQISAPLRKNPEISGCKGTYLTRQTELIARFVQLEYEDKYDLLRTQTYIDFIDTYSAAYRHQVLAQNKFDESIISNEDQELSFRLAAQGHKMVFQPSAVVYHLHSHTLHSYFRKKIIIAYWKAQVVRRFPARAAKDSHTPQVMKVQMGLMMLTAAALGLTLFVPSFGLWATAGVLTLFCITTLPFVRKAWGKDKTVALAAPFLLMVRALALTIGYIWGTAVPQTAITAEQSWWQNLKLVARTLLHGK